MKGGARGQRVAEQVRRELAELLRSAVKDPRVGMVTLTAVELSPDYAHAKVFYTLLGGAAAVPEVEAGLNRASGFLRHELGRRIHIHTLPQLHFHYDPSVERGAQISRLIDEALASDRRRGE